MRHAKKGHRVISMDILEHLQKLYPALTKKQKTIADYLIANPEEISYITLAQLSHQTGTSELTLLRFCQKLGYSNFLDLKEQFDFLSAGVLYTLVYISECGQFHIVADTVS